MRHLASKQQTVQTESILKSWSQTKGKRATSQNAWMCHRKNQTILTTGAMQNTALAIGKISKKSQCDWSIIRNDWNLVQSCYKIEVTIVDMTSIHSHEYRHRDIEDNFFLPSYLSFYLLLTLHCAESFILEQSLLVLVHLHLGYLLYFPLFVAYTWENLHNTLYFGSQHLLQCLDLDWPFQLILVFGHGLLELLKMPMLLVSFLSARFGAEISAPGNSIISKESLCNTLFSTTSTRSPFAIHRGRLAKNKTKILRFAIIPVDKIFDTGHQIYNIHTNRKNQSKSKSFLEMCCRE